MKNIIITGFTAIMASTALAVSATELQLKDTQILLQGENVKQFALQDINGDLRPDLVWLTTDGDIKYKLQDNQAVATFENIKGTKWRISYDRSGIDKYVEFTNDGGVLTDQNNNAFNLVSVTVTELNQLSFCTYIYSGLNGSVCRWKYQVTEVLPSILKGKDLNTGETWTAYKLVK